MPLAIYPIRPSGNSPTDFTEEAIDRLLEHAVGLARAITRLSAARRAQYESREGAGRGGGCSRELEASPAASLPTSLGRCDAVTAASSARAAAGRAQVRSGGSGMQGSAPVARELGSLVRSPDGYRLAVGDRFSLPLPGRPTYSARERELGTPSGAPSRGHKRARSRSQLS